MSGGEQGAERTERLDAEETVARLVECPRVDPNPLVQRSDPTEDLEGALDRCRRGLGHLATSQVVVSPQLECDPAQNSVHVLAYPDNTTEEANAHE